MAHQEFTDDVSLSDEAELWRRVPPGHVIFDSNVGRKRPSKAAFDDHKDGSPMSVVLADLVLQSGRTPQHIVAGHYQFALAAFSAGLARSKQQGVARDPVPGEPAHALVFGKKTDSVKRALARGSVWVIEPPDDVTPQQ
jgi:hypothetical protein